MCIPFIVSLYGIFNNNSGTHNCISLNLAKIDLCDDIFNKGQKHFYRKEITTESTRTI